MKIYKHPLLFKNSVSTLLGVRPLTTLFVVLCVSSFPGKAFPHKETTTPKTFADWCLNQQQESTQTQHTVDVLLQVAKTTDCHQASKLLSARTELSLYDKQITDLRPLSSLTNLSRLYLTSNQIADLKPLSSLTKLTGLYLTSNQIADPKPLSTLTNLTELWLNDNQITNIKPLSTLTNLTELWLYNNPSLTDKTCPVNPESICDFVPLPGE